MTRPFNVLRTVLVIPFNNGEVNRLGIQHRKITEVIRRDRRYASPDLETTLALAFEFCMNIELYGDETAFETLVDSVTTEFNALNVTKNNFLDNVIDFYTTLVTDFAEVTGDKIMEMIYSRCLGHHLIYRVIPRQYSITIILQESED